MNTLRKVGQALRDWSRHSQTPVTECLDNFARSTCGRAFRPVVIFGVSSAVKHGTGGSLDCLRANKHLPSYPSPLPMGEGDDGCAPHASGSLSLWERAGVRGTAWPLVLATATLCIASTPTVVALDRIVTPWSFKPLHRPAVPKVANDTWSRDDIDRFILAGLTAKNLKPNADAPRAALIRRATLDLHGLLPTPEEVAGFEKDVASDDQALAKVIDRLLQSPRFGERWARHWLDVVRYADSVGRSWNAPFIQAFRYRDWVIDSLNSDKPYTRFIAEQIAGDLLPAKTDVEKQQNIIGTGFLTLGCVDLTALQYEQFVMDRVDDQIDVTTRAFLGLTIACARCHDHKTDPVSQHDYYALAGMFYSTDTRSGTAHKAELGANLYVDPDRLITLPVTKPMLPPAKSTSSALKSGEVNAMDDMQPSMTQKTGRFATTYIYDPRLAMGVSDGDIQNCPIRIAGDPYDEGKTPKRGDLTIPSLPSMPKVEGKTSGRYQLAQWICQPTHPLTSRVMANRIWAHLFGKGIVGTVDNFGITGTKPVNEALLDHIAIRFVESGWSVKKFIRAVMLSRAYRLSVDSNALAIEADPANELHWRMSPRRVELEVMRDSLLQLSGELTYERPDGIQVTGNGGKGNTGRTSSKLGIESPYRTVYLPVLRDLLPETHETWDFPNPTQIKGQREVTTVPSQSLFMMNNRIVVDAAKAVAVRLLDDKSLSNDKARVRHAYRILFSRDADDDESQAALEMMQSLETPSDEKEKDTYRWATMIQALMGSAEFRYAM